MRRLPLLLLAVPLALAGCSSGSVGGAASAATTSAPTQAPSTSPAPATSPAAPPAVKTSAAAPSSGGSACTASGGAVPAGAERRQTLDVDGDGRPDTVWIAREPGADGGVPFGIATAAGGGFSATIRSASPVARSVLVADVTGRGELIALASDGRQVLLYGISGCSLVPEQNVQGQQYAFDLGFTGFGTGVGCVDADGDGTTDLVGLQYVPEPNGAGTIRRTAVELAGAQARNGATDTVPVTRASEADEAQSVTCGDLSLAEDGVTSGP